MLGEIGGIKLRNLTNVGPIKKKEKTANTVKIKLTYDETY